MGGGGRSMYIRQYRTPPPPSRRFPLVMFSWSLSRRASADTGPVMCAGPAVARDRLGLIGPCPCLVIPVIRMSSSKILT